MGSLRDKYGLRKKQVIPIQGYNTGCYGIITGSLRDKYGFNLHFPQEPTFSEPKITKGSKNVSIVEKNVVCTRVKFDQSSRKVALGTSHPIRVEFQDPFRIANMCRYLTGRRNKTNQWSPISSQKMSPWLVVTVDGLEVAPASIL